MYRKGRLHGNANASNRLQLKFKSTDLPVPVEAVLLILAVE